MTVDKTGGPAFPHGDMRGIACVGGAEFGMTLRDYIAAKAPITEDMALNAYGCKINERLRLTDDATRSAFFAVWTLLRYEFADAMIAARGKHE